MALMQLSDKLRPYVLIAFIAFIFLLLWFLFAMFRREAVKRDLYQHGCRPKHIWWCVWVYWAPAYYDAMPFHVVYLDPFGAVHKARCYVTHNLFGPAFGPRVVRWVKDEIINQPSSPQVWVDSEIVRPKLRD